jgi:hypothetical protein
MEIDRKEGTEEDKEKMCKKAVHLNGETID